MTYAVQSQLIERYTEQLLLDLTDRANPPAGVVDAAVVERALVGADSIIDGYLAGKYRLPLAEVPPQINDLALAIAIYKLHPFVPDEKIKDDYDGALKMLREIASGAFRLPLAGVEPDARSDSGVKTTDRPRPFSNESLSGFV